MYNQAFNFTIDKDKEALFFDLAVFLFDLSITLGDRQLCMGQLMYPHNTVQKLKVNM